MRRPERIDIILPILLDNDNKKKILEYFFKPEEGAQIKLHEPYNDIAFHVSRWQENFESFEKMWREYPDLRITQVLVNSGILPNYPGFWYHTEDEKLMIKCEFLKPREIYFWGRNFDENLVKLPKTEYVLIKDMNKGHIEAILNHNRNSDFAVNPYYVALFEEELKLR